MTTAAQVEQLREANRAVEAAALLYLRDFWSTLDLTNPRVVRRALMEFVPALTTQQGEVAAVVAADWYDDIRSSAGVRRSFRAIQAEPFPVEYVQQRVQYGTRHLFTDTPGQALNFLDGAVQEYTLQPGRDTVQESSIRDPQSSGWHRETRPSDSYASGCRFCRMLAGRGGVYKRQSVTFAAHGDCHCVAYPSWDPDAPEVPVEAYVASQRTSRMSDAQRARHNATVRSYLDAYVPD